MCVINRRKAPPVVVGTIYPNRGTKMASFTMSPVLDVVMVRGNFSSEIEQTEAPCAFFASSHSDGRVLLWAVFNKFASPSGMTFRCVAIAQSPVSTWPIESLKRIELPVVDNNSAQLVFQCRNKLYRIDIPLNVNYT